MNDQDLITIGQEASRSLLLAKQSLQKDNPPDLEAGRDDCIEKANAVKTVINHFEDKMEEIRKKKRKLDDEKGDLQKVLREFESLKSELAENARRCNNAFWDLKKGRKMHDPHAG